jgi:GTPase SAR1 family protein
MSDDTPGSVMNASPTVSLKVVLIGNLFTGKTSILSRYRDNLFPENQQPTPDLAKAEL